MNNKALVAIAIMLVFVVPIGLGFLLNMEDVEQRSIITSNTVDITDALNNSDTITSINYTGPNNNDVIYYKYTSGAETIIKFGSPEFIVESDKPSSNPLFHLESDVSTSPVNVSIDNTAGVDIKYVDVPASAGFVYSFSVNGGNQTVKMIQDTGYEVILSPPSGTTFYVLVYGSIVYTAKYDVGTGYSMISSQAGIVNIQIGEVQGHSDTIQVMPRNSEPTLYGQPAYGWKLPSDVPDNTDVTWYNGFRNTSLTFVIDLGVPGTDHILYIKNLILHQKTDGMVEYGLYNPVEIGKYRYFYITLVYDDYNNSVTKTVYGINKWPPMGSVPTTYTSYQDTDINTSLDFVVIKEIGGRSVFRVDSATIRDSTIPVIDNNSYDALDYYPQSTGYSIKIDKSSIDPTSISFGSHTYTVTDRQITVNGIKYNVAGSTFTSIYDADTARWINTINDQSIGNSATNPILSFGGVSSMELSQSAAGYHIDTYSTQWVPGHFAFNVSDYALIGLITSIAAFVILGMAGIRSGGKVLWLAAICGGAAIIFITLI